ncbi:MAG: hypothetical protein JST68_23020 [Bacteroidetes bacterium]|nr:hypothetical protein [Bacteroidota bacterium]
MTSSISRTTFVRPLASGLLGLTLMLPASFFLLTLLARIIFGAKAMYYYIAPSFLQSPMNLFSFHKAQMIIISLVLAILFNALTIFRFDLERGKRGLEVAVTYRRYWLNTAIALQAVLLLLVLVAYTFIQHIRY